MHHFMHALHDAILARLSILPVPTITILHGKIYLSSKWKQFLPSIYQTKQSGRRFVIYLHKQKYLMKKSLRQNLFVEKYIFSVNTAVNWYQAGYSKSLITSDLNNGLISYSRTRYSNMITVSTNFYHRKKENIDWAKRFRLGSFIKWIVRRHINYHEYGTRKIFYF